MIQMDKKTATAAIYGGLFLGGGGGGSIKNGLKEIEEVFKIGKFELKNIDEFDENDFIITASAVGSPASKDGFISKEHITNIYKLLKDNEDIDIKGIITNENGGASTANGWILSAITGIPVVDAPCNGRAHPTGTMGSMGLSQIEDYSTVQVSAGGKKENSLELLVKGNLESCSRLVRSSAVEAKGLVTVLRNPVKVAYVKENAAIGGIEQAIEIGTIFVENKDTNKILEKLKDLLKAEVLCDGEVKSYEIKIEGGFDVGKVEIEKNNSEISELVFWNEYMTYEENGKRKATFPDLIVTMDKNKGEVLNSSDIREGQEIIVIKVNRDKLKLGKGMFDKKLFYQVEKVINKEIVKYSFGG
ncbi:MAG: DUF917 family protein [Bacillota bacterium]|nr:DUF917 family protein [Bacillota bacterium]